MPVAIYNTKSKALHHPTKRCGHFSWGAPSIEIASWTSAEGFSARAQGHACKSCVSMFNFTVPPRYQEYDNA